MILLDLFSGAGGFHLGLEQAGFEFDKVYFSEIDKHAIQIYKEHFKGAEYVGSVESIPEIERPNVITFGSPCQDFSLAGKRAGMDGERSSLITFAIDLIKKYRPDFFIWENVKGAFSSNDGEDFWGIIQAFANIGGYRLEWQLLNTAWFLPQNRERIYLVGCLGDGSGKQIFPIGEAGDEFDRGDTIIANSLQHPGHSGGNYRGMTMIMQKSEYRKTGKTTMKDIVPTLKSETKKGDTEPLVIMRERRTDEAKAIRKETGTNPFRAKKLEESDKCGAIGTTKNSDNIVKYPCLNPNVSIRSSGNADGSRNYYTDKISQTISANPTSDNLPMTSPTLHGFEHGTNGHFNNQLREKGMIRRLTPIECERLQGFPDGWTASVSDTQRYKLMGNAVSVPVVKAVADKLKEGL